MKKKNQEVGATIIRLLTDIDNPSEAVDVLTGVIAIVFSVLPVEERRQLKALTDISLEVIGDTVFEDGDDFEDFVNEHIIADIPYREDLL